MKNTPVYHGIVSAKARSAATSTALLLLALAGTTTAQTVINGGFEFDPVSPDSPGGILHQAEGISGWQIVRGGDLFLVTSQSREHGLGAPAGSSTSLLKDAEPIKDGDAKASNQYVANLLSSVGSTLSNSIITQSIGGFEAKKEYSLNYFIADYFGGDKFAALLNVSIYGSGGALLTSFEDSIKSDVGFADESFTGNENTVWKSRSLNFKPDGETISIAFDFGPEGYQSYPTLKLDDGSGEGDKFFYTAGLDSVSITAVTIPEPSSILLLGTFGGLAALRRRRAI